MFTTLFFVHPKHVQTTGQNIFMYDLIAFAAEQKLYALWFYDHNGRRLEVLHSLASKLCYLILE